MHILNKGKNCNDIESEGYLTIINRANPAQREKEKGKGERK